VALVQPAAAVALRQKRPDQVVVLVGKREVTAAELRQSEPADQRLRRVGDVGASRALDRTCWLGSSASRSRSRRSSCGSFPVHPTCRAGSTARSGAPQTVRTRCLQRLTNSAMPYASMSRLLVKPRSFSTLTSDPQPLTVKAVLVALVAALHRPETAGRGPVGTAPGVNEHPIGLGRERVRQEAPALATRVLARRRAKVRRSATGSGSRALGDEIGLGADWSKHHPRCSEFSSVCEWLGDNLASGRPPGRGSASPRHGTFVTRIAFAAILTNQ